MIIRSQVVVRDGVVFIKSSNTKIGKVWKLETKLWRNSPTRRMWTGSKEESIAELLSLWNDNLRRF